MLATFALPDVSSVVEITGTWCVLSVVPQREAKVASRLRDADISHYLPCVKTRRIYAKRKVEVEVPIYQEYVFACYADEKEYGRIHETKQVIRIIPVHRFDQDELVAQLAGLERLLEHDPWLDVTDWQREGRKVKVIRGPLLGIEGRIIKRRDRDVLMVGVEMFGQCVELDVDSVDVEPI